MWDIMAKWHKRIIITALFGAHEFIFMHFNAIATQKHSNFNIKNYMEFPLTSWSDISNIAQNSFKTFSFMRRGKT